jgi:phosphatidate phosphatase PAH1
VRLAALLVILAGGTAAAETVQSTATETKPMLDDTRCAAPPTVKAVGWRHTRSRLIAKTGSPNHRGIDLIATEDDATQTIEGKLAYGKIDKDIDKEDAELFACIGNTWRSLGIARTYDDGRLAMTLTGAARLPPGMRDMYIAALGDGSGGYFVAYVAPRGTKIVVTDVDGTISWSENSIIKQVIDRDRDIKTRPNAPKALAKLPYPIVYTTARGDAFIHLTRRWLERHGFPRGLLRLSRGAFAKPGSSAIAYKTKTLKALTIPIAAGIGNRKSDITAYTNIGLDGKRIFIHLPEYEKEVKSEIAAGKAIGFADYLQLPSLVP